MNPPHCPNCGYTASSAGRLTLPPDAEGHARRRQRYVSLCYTDGTEDIWEVDIAIYSALAPICHKQEVADLVTAHRTTIRRKGTELLTYLDEHIRPHLKLDLAIVDGPRDPSTGERTLTKFNYHDFSGVGFVGTFEPSRMVTLSLYERTYASPHIKFISGLTRIDWDEMFIAS